MHQPLGCYPYRLIPSFPREQELMKNQQIEHLNAAKIISRINGFTYVETQFDYFTGEVKELSKTAYSNGPRAKVNCYGADDVREGVAIMHKDHVLNLPYGHLQLILEYRKIVNQYQLFWQHLLL